MNPLEAHPDLQELLEAAQEKTLERGNIWCQRSLGFKSSAEFRKGLVLGGALSPFYLLEDPPWGSVQKRVPWTLSVTQARVLVAEPVTSSFQEWVPLLEALAKANEALLLITPAVQDESLFAIFIVNAHAKSVVCCPVSPGQVYTEKLQVLVSELASLQPTSDGRRLFPYLTAGEAPHAEVREWLPVASEVWVRAEASLALPQSEAEWASLLGEVAILNVGGKTFEDQGERLRLMAQAVQNMTPGLLLSL